MSNQFSNLSDAAANALAAQMVTVLTPNILLYGLTLPDVTAIGSAQTAFAADLLDVAAKKAAFRASVNGKETDKGTMIDKMAYVAAKIYNNSAVTDEMILAAGLKPHSPNHTKLQPKQPQTLVATPFADGSVKLAWSKGENKYGSVYLIESRGETGDWTVVFTTTKQSATIAGFTPGVCTWFRITASRNEQVSLPSNEAAIYHTGDGEGFLSVAA